MQSIIEIIMSLFAKDFILASKYTNSDSVSPKDIELTLFIQNKMFLINKVKVNNFPLEKNK